MANDKIDLGHDFSMRYIGWAPDRTIPANAERYAHVADIEKVGILVTCQHGIEGIVYFDTLPVRRVFPEGDHWTVEQWEPLTLSPSILCHGCGCHGYIREGRWVPA